MKRKIITRGKGKNLNLSFNTRLERELNYEAVNFVLPAWTAACAVWLEFTFKENAILLFVLN